MPVPGRTIGRKSPLRALAFARRYDINQTDVLSGFGCADAGEEERFAMSVAELETRPARGRERTTGPRLRPASGVRAPRLRSAAASAQPRACRSTPAPPT